MLEIIKAVEAAADRRILIDACEAPDIAGLKRATGSYEIVGTPEGGLIWSFHPTATQPA